MAMPPSEASAPAPLPDPLIPTIFHEPWWLEIASEGGYALAEIKENGVAVGRLPYFLRRRCGLTYSIMPPMTHFLGPAIAPGVGSAATRFLRQNLLSRELIQQLPPAALYQYKCHRDITDAIPFQQEHFATSVQFTFEVAPAAHDVLWKNMRSEKRKKIRRAMQQVTLHNMTDAQEFWRFYDANISRRHLKNLCGEKLVCRLIEAAVSRGQGQLYAAKEKNGELTAALFCIWDHTTCYHFMSTRTVGAHNNAVSLLTWEAMKDAASRNLIFDFDGINTGSSVLFFTEFGGTVSPRYIVTRHTALGKLALLLRDHRRENRYFF